MMKTILISALLALGYPGSPAEPQPAVEPAYGGASTGLFNLSFKGGSPRELVMYLASAIASTPNVLIPPDLAEVKIPAMELRSVDLRAVFDSLNVIYRDSMLWVRSGSSGAPVWVLSRAPDTRQTRAFYIGHLLAKFKIDDITTAVRSTWELGGRESRAELKYHQDTQLLLALGSTAQLNSMAEVLTQLKLATGAGTGDPEPVPAKNAKSAKP